jgi:hypothetical protein
MLKKKFASEEAISELKEQFDLIVQLEEESCEVYYVHIYYKNTISNLLQERIFLG